MKQGKLAKNYDMVGGYQLNMNLILCISTRIKLAVLKISHIGVVLIGVVRITTTSKPLTKNLGYNHLPMVTVSTSLMTQIAVFVLFGLFKNLSI